MERQENDRLAFAETIERARILCETAQDLQQDARALSERAAKVRDAFRQLRAKRPDG